MDMILANFLIIETMKKKMNNKLKHLQIQPRIKIKRVHYTLASGGELIEQNSKRKWKRKQRIETPTNSATNQKSVHCTPASTRELIEQNSKKKWKRQLRTKTPATSATEHDIWAAILINVCSEWRKKKWKTENESPKANPGTLSQ